MKCSDKPLKIENEIKQKWSKKVKNWEKKNGRVFSWRVDRTPYKVLVSELLLKRTTSTAASRIYNNFLSFYPDIIHLAEATYNDLEDIFRDIGLYKQRSLQVKKMAEYMVQKFNGNIPDTYLELVEVPGIGDYIASAVLVFGYGKPKAVVDSNVERVIGRAFNAKGKTLKEIAEALIPKIKADVYNYGLLDIGSKVCHYRFIKCEKCPVNNYCLFSFKNNL